MFRTCKKTLDIAIFTFTRDSIAQAILDAHQRGLKVRCIGDDGNSKVKGSDVRLLASVGIPCKTDNNIRFHMHNKMAIIDNSVVITGSFNWTNQAINKNQDNILFIEDKNIANQYTEYFNKVWDSFQTVITKEDAKKYLEEEKKAQEKKDEEKEKINKKDENAKKETTKKETAKKETTKKETAKKETAKKETEKKETAKKEKTKKKKEKKEKKKKKKTKKKAG
jgi:cardiolipin hydrolase